jgi:hypothetical protein
MDTIVSQLAAAGADVDARDDTGAAPIHVAAFQGHVAVTRALLTAGANPAAVDARGRSPLDLAFAKGSATLVKLLDTAVKGRRARGEGVNHRQLVRGRVGGEALQVGWAEPLAAVKADTVTGAAAHWAAAASSAHHGQSSAAAAKSSRAVSGAPRPPYDAPFDFPEHLRDVNNASGVGSVCACGRRRDKCACAVRRGRVTDAPGSEGGSKGLDNQNGGRAIAGQFYWRHGGVKEAASGPRLGPNMHEDALRGDAKP